MADSDHSHYLFGDRSPAQHDGVPAYPGYAVVRLVAGGSCGGCHSGVSGARNDQRHCRGRVHCQHQHLFCVQSRLQTGVCRIGQLPAFVELPGGGRSAPQGRKGDRTARKQRHIQLSDLFRGAQRPAQERRVAHRDHRRPVRLPFLYCSAKPLYLPPEDRQRQFREHSGTPAGVGIVSFCQGMPCLRRRPRCAADHLCADRCPVSGQSFGHTGRGLRTDGGQADPAGQSRFGAARLSGEPFRRGGFFPGRTRGLRHSLFCPRYGGKPGAVPRPASGGLFGVCQYQTRHRASFPSRAGVAAGSDGVS